MTGASTNLRPRLQNMGARRSCAHFRLKEQTPIPGSVMRSLPILSEQQRTMPYFRETPGLRISCASFPNIQTKNWLCVLRRSWKAAVEVVLRKPGTGSRPIAAGTAPPASGLAGVRAEAPIVPAAVPQEPPAALRGRATGAGESSGDLLGEGLPNGVDEPQRPRSGCGRG